MIDLVYFFDGNHAGVLYCGTYADADLLAEHGGAVQYWTHSTPDIGSTVSVTVDCKEEQWPVERPNFAQPWW